MTKKFVVSTDEVWRLQRGDDPDCVFFQAMAEQGHYGGRPGASRQGIYVCSPGGKFLASVNSTDPQRVLQMLQRGLQRWNELPLGDRNLVDSTQVQPRHRWEDSFPQDGLVLTMFTRDLPPSGDVTQSRASKWNQDPVWFSHAEARQWLPAVMEQGKEYPLPNALAMRLIRLHLVDMVKGQSQTFSKNEIQKSRVRLKISELTKDHAKVSIAGETYAESTRESRRTSRHGVQTQLRGTAVFDLGTRQFTKFDLVAIGTRWGHTRFNGRRRDSEQSYVGFVFTLADPGIPPIAPAFIAQYETEWVKTPKP